MPFNDARYDPTPCPYCQKSLDAATNVSSTRTPHDGDYTICVYCAEPLAFENNLKLRKCRPGELAGVYMLHPDFGLRFQTALRLTKKFVQSRRRGGGSFRQNRP